MTTPLSLLYNGTEKTLADWGYGIDAKLTLLSQAPSKFTVSKELDDPTSDEDIPNWGVVEIWKDRTVTAGVFSGGTRIFVGRRTDFDRVAQPDNPKTMRVFEDPWYDLTTITFQHYWWVYVSGTKTKQLFSRINLFQDIGESPEVPWGYLTTAQQITQIIQYAADATLGRGIAGGKALQVGTIDPSWTLPVYGVKAIQCSDAILKCLQSMADAVTYFDYTTTPPTLHVRQRANLASVSLPFDNGGSLVPYVGYRQYHQNSRIRSRPDLIPTSVTIQYQTTSTVNGVTYVVPSTDTWPVGANQQAMGAHVEPIDMRGGTVSTLTATVVSNSFDPTTVDFWKSVKPDLGTSNVTGLSLLSTAVNSSTDPNSITIKDDQGNNVSLTDYPYLMKSTGSEIATWMKKPDGTQITGKKVTITATVSYTSTTIVNGVSIPNSPHNAQVTYECKLTNSPPGSSTASPAYGTKYSATATAVQADPVITGLAQSIYTSLAQLQWEGTHVILEENIYQCIGPGTNLNLVGGRTEWETMNASIVHTEIDFQDGRTTVTFGPHKHLSAATIASYMTLLRFRTVYDNPALRQTGQSDANNNIQYGQDHHVSNTNHSIIQHKILPIIADQTTDTTSTPTTGLPPAQVILDARQLADHTPTGGVGGLMASLPAAQRIVQFAKVPKCRGGAVKYAVMPIGPDMNS